MDAAEEVARYRLSVLELAQALGSVSESCHRSGMARTQFYIYKRRFQTHGLEGLEDFPPIQKTHPQTTPPRIVEKILTVKLRCAGPRPMALWSFSQDRSREFFRKAFREKFYASVEELPEGTTTQTALTGVTGTWAGGL
ncbi:MAG: helix-turn-helix domain-containing protein [Desulfitobacteriaceae bacterium]|nr:helix-turn-helix domain-containing protein [Desulfitobacteriaceae bacterium]